MPKIVLEGPNKTHRTCTTCKELKVRSDMIKRRSAKDGMDCICSECASIKVHMNQIKKLSDKERTALLAKHLFVINRITAVKDCTPTAKYIAEEVALRKTLT